MGANSSGLKWELERQLAVLNSQFNRRVLIDLFIWNDDQNSSRHVIYVCNALGEWRVWNWVSRLLVPDSGLWQQSREIDQDDGWGDL
jgi:hypothetical protein